MSISAYIFFTIELGKTHEVIDNLRKIPQLTNISVVTGDYDVIAKITFEVLEELYHITTQEIHHIEGIININTAIVEKEVKQE